VSVTESDLRLPTQLPDPDDVEACAAFRLVHGDRISAILSWNIRSSKAIKAAVEKRGGPIQTRFGAYGEIFDGWEYGPEIVDRLPGFGVYEVVFQVETPEQLERAQSLLFEELGNVVRDSWDATTKVNVKACRLAVETLEPESERRIALLELRKKKKKLGRVDA
jgi:hypothetical protein